MALPVRTSQHRRVRSALVLVTLAGFLCVNAGRAHADFGDCGQPISAGSSPVATDALFLLGAAVGTQTCEPCICDVNDDGAITATDALLDLNAAVGQPVSLSCSSCPLECPDEEGCELSEGMTEDDRPLVLQTTGGQVTVPPNALPAGVTVTLREVTPELADSLPDGLGEELLSNIFDLTLSEHVQPMAPIILEASVPSPRPLYFRGRLKVSGNRIRTDARDEEWQLYVGRFDEATSRLAFTLFGGVGRVSAAIVEPTDEESSLVTILPPSAAALGYSDSPPVRAPGGPEAILLGENGWAVICSGLQYALHDLTDPSCDPEAFVGFLPPLVAGEIRKAGDFIRGLGFTSAVVQTVTGADLERSLFPVGYSDTEDASAVSPSAEYNVAKMVPFLESGARGDYDAETAQLRFRVRSGVLTKDESDAIAHELMHAVQASHGALLQNAKWTLEGIADAVGYAFVEPNLQSRLDRRKLGPRNWNVELYAESDVHRYQYQAAEFWFSVGSGTLGYLGPFYDSFSFDAPVSGTESLVPANAALMSAGLGGGRALAEQYLKLLQTRNDDKSYPHCRSVTCNLGSSCTGETSGSQGRMTAECLDVTISGANRAVCLSVVADNPGLSEGLKAIIAGDVYEEGEVVRVKDQVRVWPVNQLFESELDIGYGILVEDCEGGFSLRRQVMGLRGNAVAAMAFDPPSDSGAPVRVSVTEFYTSVEEQFPASDRFFRRDTTTNERTLREETDEEVAPIGFESFERAYSTSASWDAEPPGTTSRQANAEVSVESETKGNRTTLTTSGTLGAFGTSSDPMSEYYAGGGSASVAYSYQTIGAPVEVTLTWPCTFSAATLHYRGYPSGPTFERILNEGKVSPDDEFLCGTHSWVIPPGTQFQIAFQAEYNSNFESPLLNGNGLDSPGGSFEIEVRAIDE